jgi:tight adherence protein C
MDPLALGCSLLWSLSAAGLAWYCVSIARQITYVTLADGRRQARTLPLIFRLLLPLAQNFRPLFSRPLFAGMKVRLDRKITSAGFEGLLSAEEFLSLRALMPLFLGLLFWVPFVKMAVAAAPKSMLASMDFALYAIGILWFFFYPAMWLTRELDNRHKRIRRALPFVLDLLTLCVEAGLDFMTSLQRNIDRRAIDALGEELIRVVREIQLGKTRRESLRDMSKRVNLAELRSVVNALVQADELGVSIGFILRVQSDQMRQRRFERAERLANEAPVKMLFPLIFFIFPAVFLVLMGPIVNKLIGHGIL